MKFLWVAMNVNHQVKKIALYALNQAVKDVTGHDFLERLVAETLHCLNCFLFQFGYIKSWSQDLS
jgi:hypothetical protein